MTHPMRRMAAAAPLAVLLALNWAVFGPGGPEPVFELDLLRERLGGPLGLRERRYEDVSLLPEHHVLLLAEREQPLLSIYVGCYPRMDASTQGPHDPEMCYPSFGYEVREVGSTTVRFEGRDAGVRTARVVVPDGELLVTWWPQSRGQPPPPADAPQRAFDELWTRWQTGRTDLVWVRLEWDAAARPAQPDFDAIVATVMATVRDAVRVRG